MPFTRQPWQGNLVPPLHPECHSAGCATISEHIWTLWDGATRVDNQRATRPRSRAQLVKLVDHAAFEVELVPGVADPSIPSKLKGLIGAASKKPTADPEVLAAAVEALKGELGSTPPLGNEAPKKTQGSKSTYVRDPKVVRWVLDRARGICELCRRPAPFLDSKGEPFLEVHHVVQLADGGPDTVRNARGLCPNCHREVHLGLNKSNLVLTLVD